MDGQRIVFTAPCKAELLPFPLPDALLKGMVLVKTVVSTVSPGTERAVLSDSPNCGGYQPHVFPRQSGYSSSGIVLSVGEGVSSVSPGQRVIVFWGSHSSLNLVPENQVVPIPDGVSFEAAAAVFIATFSLAALRKCRLEIGESALVMGCGLLGQLAVKLLRAAGAAPVIAVDPVPQRRAEALLHGADLALDPFDPGFAQTVRLKTQGGARVVIEVTGLGAGLDQALDCTARFGRVALLGCTRSSDFTIDYYRKVHTPGITLIGAHTKARPETDSAPGWFTQRDDILCVLSLLLHGRVSFDDLLPQSPCNPAQCGEVYASLLSDPAFPTLHQFDWRRL